MTAAMKELDDGNFAIAITTPLMKRISCGFIINDLDVFYEMKLLDISLNRPPQYLHNK